MGMKATAKLRELGQSLWLDNITRRMLDAGQLHRYIEEFSVTGLTSNPTIFDKAIQSGAYDDEIHDMVSNAVDLERLFFDIALEDLRRAADLFAPVHARTDGVDGWVSLEVSPLFAYDTGRTARAATALHARARRDNLFIKIPGTEQGLPAIEEAIFAGVPVNVTLLFSREQYVGAAEAYMRGIERRIEAGRDPEVGSVASVFVSRWDAAVRDQVAEQLRGRLGLAVGLKIYQAHAELLTSERWLRLAYYGARPQRLLWASTSTKDPSLSDTLYVEGLSAPHTINTMPESTLLAFADHGQVGEPMVADGGGADATLAQFASAGVDIHALGATLQSDGARKFANSWIYLLNRIGEQVTLVKT
jgi:transaldolase